MSRPSFADLTVREFFDRLGSNDPTPGGGTAGAIAGAMGASLVRMLAAVTVGKPKFAAVEGLMNAVAETMADARARLLELADLDSASFDAVSAAFKQPKATEAEQAARKQAIEAALKGACSAPLKVMEQCLEVIGAGKQAVLQGNPNAASDGAAGVELARAGMAIAAYNVRINLVGIGDAKYAKDMRTRVDEMLYMGGTVSAEVDSKVQEMWKPKGGKV